MTEPPKRKRRDIRINFLVNEDEREAISNWMDERRIRSEGDAIRRLIVLGIEASKEKSKPSKPETKSR
jgi:hypothetical protein